MGKLHQGGGNITEEKHWRKPRESQSQIPQRTARANRGRLMTGIFCETFGHTNRNKILEFFLEMSNTDYGLADIARLLNMNKATVYNTAGELINKQIITPHRTLGRTQTYILNKKNPTVQFLIQTFHQMLNTICEQEAKLLLSQPSAF